MLIYLFNLVQTIFLYLKQQLLQFFSTLHMDWVGQVKSNIFFDWISLCTVFFKVHIRIRIMHSLHASVYYTCCRGITFVFYSLFNYHLKTSFNLFDCTFHIIVFFQFDLSWVCKIQIKIFPEHISILRIY